jgi:hypothetical protein
LNGGATANGAAGHAPQPSSSASEAEKGEVKLVRLDRRRIVTLPPPKPEEPRASAPRPRPERSAPTKERVSESSKSSSVESVRTSIESARTSAFESEKSERGYRVPAGLDLAVQRAQAKKRVSAVLSELSVEQQRFVLLDLLAEITNELPPLPAATADDPKLRGRILAAVGNRLGISLGQLATTIFGEDTPSNRRRVKALSGEETD